MFYFVQPHTAKVHVETEMDKPLSEPKPLNGIKSRASTFRCFFKQQSISSTLSIGHRIAPAWSRMLRFGNTTKFKTDELFQVNYMVSHFFSVLLSPPNLSLLAHKIIKWEFLKN